MKYNKIYIFGLNPKKAQMNPDWLHVFENCVLRRSKTILENLFWEHFILFQPRPFFCIVDYAFNLRK